LCPTLYESCGRNTCQEGSCLFETLPGACAAEEACIPNRGCVMLVFIDASAPDASGGDAEIGDAALGRDSGVCDNGASCERPGACELGVVDCSSGAAVCVAGGAAPAGGVCRAAVGACDAEEVDDGVPL
jgi:hypothetical protein